MKENIDIIGCAMFYGLDIDGHPDDVKSYRDHLPCSLCDGYGCYLYKCDSKNIYVCEDCVKSLQNNQCVDCLSK